MATATRARAALGDITGLNVNRQNVQAEGKPYAAAKPHMKSAFDAAAPSLSVKEPVDKVDLADVGNAQTVVPYLGDIHRHYREAESINRASANYMSKQTDINMKMRAILIDWLVEVHLKFKLLPETAYLTVDLIDRFLGKEVIARNKLQLVGVTAMFMASKYEEIYAPECRDFVYICDKAFTREQILAMEKQMLSALNFQLTTPNALVFLKRFTKVAGVISNPRTKTELLANYFVELTLQEYSMLKYLPSVISAAATYLALKTMGSHAPWTAELQQHSTYTEAAILPAVRDMHKVHTDASANKLQAVRKKYSQEKHGAVSGIPPIALA